MATTSTNNSWDKIQLGVKDTERKLGQREYNAAMITARQTLEFMAKLLAERACIVDRGDLKDTIDTLYQNQWISKTTCEHYHKIRILGDKAAKEGDANAYNANQAYHMLSQEVYTFANDYSNAKKGTRVKSSARSGAPASASSSRNSGNAARNSVQSTRSYVSSSTRSRKRSGSRRPAFTAYDLMKLLIPVLCIILLFFVVKLVKPDTKEKESSSAPVATEAMQETPGASEAQSEAPDVIYRTTTTLNVRPEPSTDSERIGQLPEGTAVDYVGAHDAEWAVILYQGQEAYVASQYLSTE